jgi:hypothetical protein
LQRKKHKIDLCFISFTNLQNYFCKVFVISSSRANPAGAPKVIPSLAILTVIPSPASVADTLALIV